MEKSKPSISRQLKDIISQAENLGVSSSFESDAEIFARFNKELKVYLLLNYDEPMVLERVHQIPDVSYQRVEDELWHRILIPVWLYYTWRRDVVNSRFLRDVEEAKRLYYSIQFLLKNE